MTWENRGLRVWRLDAHPGLATKGYCFCGASFFACLGASPSLAFRILVVLTREAELRDL